MPADTPPAHNADADAEAQLQQARQKAMLEPLYRFTLEWRAPSGQMFVGEFAHKVPTVGQQVAIDSAVGRQVALAGGKLEGDARDTAVSLAHLETTLVERPPWARDLSALPYLDLLFAVAREAMAHCATFCGAPGGAGASGAVAGMPDHAAAPLVQPQIRPAPQQPAI